MKKNKNKKPTVQAPKPLRCLAYILVSASLLAFSYPSFNLSILAWVALVPLFFAIENDRPGRAFVKGYIFGVIFFAILLYWLFNISIPGAVVLILIISIEPAIFASLFSYGKKFPVFSLVFMPAAWVLTEYLRAHLFTGFPWALLGYSQCANLLLIQIADITGVYGVSFLILLVNFAIYLVIKKHPQRFYALFYILVLFVIILTYGEKKGRQVYPAQKLNVAVIQGSIPQEMKWDPAYRDFIIERYETLTEASLKENPQLVIWPETALPGYLDDDDLKGRMINFAKKNKTYILTGTLREEQGEAFNSSALVSDGGMIIGTYDKTHLVPFGEFIPFGKTFSVIRKFINKPIGYFQKGKGSIPLKFRTQTIEFKTKQIFSTTNFFEFGVLICYEDIFPEISREFVRRGARFLVNVTNDAWFGETAAPYQHMQGSVFRAVENRVPLARAANTGVSCIIDHNGKVIKSVTQQGNDIFVEGYAVATITPISAKTFYNRFGDVFAWLCAALVVLTFIPKQRGKMFFLIIALILTIPSNVYAKDEVYYRGKFKFPSLFGKKANYSDILVTRVIDGDTIELENKERVRLIGIDTPEAWFGPKLERDAKRSGKNTRTIMEMGAKATEFTKVLVEGQRVRLEFDAEKKDRYGRLLAYVYLPGGEMLNAKILREGYGQVYTFPPNLKYANLFLKLQNEARENKRGLWAE